MIQYLRAGALLALGGCLASCATITRGTTTEFTVKSKPPGAEVKTSTGFVCPATPCTFKMPRKEAFVVTVSKSGFKPVEASIKSVYADGGGVGFLGNALVGGVIGAGVDLGSGAMKDLSPNPLEVELETETVATTIPVPAATPPVTAAPPAVGAQPPSPPPATAPAPSTSTSATKT